MNFWISGEPALVAKMLKRIDVLVINEEEVRQLTGEHNIAKAARLTRQMGPKTLIIKRGEYGALLFDDAGPFFAPAYPLEEVIDPTGAGDSFAGGFLGHLAATGELGPASMRRALIVASATASFGVEGVGTTRLASLNRDVVTKRLEEFRQLIHGVDAG
jgi:sugar/nucleoside kinase (ribokinase family)